MKKICIFLLGIQLLFVSLLLLNLSNNLSVNELFYKDTTKLSFLLSKDEGKILQPDKQVDFVQDLASKYNVSFYKYIYKNAQDLTIYATDPTKNNQLTLLSGHFPEPHSTNRITNFPDQSKETVGQFLWFNTQLHITIEPFSKVTDTGVDGIYYVSTTDKKKMRDIVSELEQSLGDIEQYHHFNQQQLFLTSLFANPILSISLFVVLVVNLFVFSYYVVQNNKKVAIYQIHGLSIFSKLMALLMPIFYSTIIISLVAYISTFFYTYLRYGGFYANGLFIKGLLLTVTLLLLLFLFTAMLILFLQKKYMGLSNSIKGKKPLKVILILNNVIKLFFIIVLLLSVSQTTKTVNSLSNELRSEHYWKRTQDIYKTELRFITQDTDKYRPYELKLKKFYEVAEKKGLFLIDVENYDKLMTGEYLYEANTSNFEEQFTSASGRSVTINRNYLSYNPIKKENGEWVTEKDLIRENNTLNILVPVELKKYKKSITTNFLDDFQFKKNVMESVSNREDLNINIVYVKQGQTYFTFNPYIQLKNKNSITDPIAIVDTNNLDASFYGSWLTRSVFFESKEEDGYLYLLPSIKETDTLASIQSVKSIYNEKVDTINQLKQRVYYLKISTAILFVVLLLNCISFFSAYFEKNKYAFSIRRVHGYSYFKMLLPFLLLTISIDMFVSITVMAALNDYGLVFPILVILFIQGFLLGLYCFVTNKKISAILNKGELE